MKADLIRKMRRLNPNVLVLTSINAVENNEVPADYFLKDIHGNRVEVWPGSYRLNLTRPEVADYQANYAVRLILENELQFDGCFFDNVFLSQSWQKTDIRGRAFPYDSDGDGKPDDPQGFDRRWRAGVLRELQAFRRRMPHALTCGHALDLGEPVVREAFNGISFGFYVPNVIEGRSGFGDFLSLYDAWMTRTRAPHLTMIESAPPNQIGYGYGYEPMKTMPPRTLEFARTFYPYMRFGLALTLLNDGYFAHEIGDTWHGNDWWYDELNFNLGRLRAGEALSQGQPEGPRSGAKWRLFRRRAGPLGSLGREEQGLFGRRIAGRGQFARQPRGPSGHPRNARRRLARRFCPGTARPSGRGEYEVKFHDPSGPHTATAKSFPPRAGPTGAATDWRPTSKRAPRGKSTYSRSPQRRPHAECSGLQFLWGASPVGSRFRESACRGEGPKRQLRRDFRTRHRALESVRESRGR